ncbi:MAG TPA: hypothetical protein VFC67_03705 [Prolixibacteraceae bacterium]|nr:hypothetical protein [Prolixibacteraceae bacterium]
MKISRILLVFLVVSSLALSSNAAEKKFKKIVGVWEFAAPNAPQPYDSGVLTLKELDNKLAAEFTIQGQAMAVPQADFADNTLTLGFEVENTPITLVLKLKDGVLEGATDTPNGQVTVTAKPQKKEAK